MYELTLQQTDAVEQFVKRQQIVFSHLSDDLIDHLCCDLEESIRDGTDFDKAFRMLKKKIGKDGVKKIQQDTLYAVDSKYRNMKNLMKLSGVAGTILLGFSTIFKLQHWPLAGALMVLGALILIVFFLPSSLTVFWKECKSGRSLLVFLAGFLASALFVAGIIFKVQHWPAASGLLAAGILMALFVLMPIWLVRSLRAEENGLPGWVKVSIALTLLSYGLGFLAKLMHWPGASLLLTIGIVLLAAVAVPGYFYYRWKDDENVSPEALFIIFTIVMFVVPSALISLNPYRNFGDLFIKSASLNNRNIEFRNSRNEDMVGTLLAGSTSVDLSDLFEMRESVTRDISAIEDELIGSFNEIKEAIYGLRVEIGDQLFDYNTAEALLKEDNELISVLRNDLNSYQAMIVESDKSAQDSFNYERLDLETYLPLSSDQVKSTHRSPIALINSLETLKGALLDAEAHTIRNYNSIIINQNQQP